MARSHQGNNQSRKTRSRSKQRRQQYRSEGISLEANAETFRKIFDHSNDAILIVDPEEDAILQANPRASKMLGFAKETLLATPVSAIHPEEMPKLAEFARSVFASGYGWTNELSCLTHAGTRLPAEISASVVELNGRRRLLIMVRDITERKRAERALVESEKRFHAMARLSPAIVFQANAEGEVAYINERWQQLTGFRSEESLRDGWLQAVHPEDRERVKAEWNRAVQEGVPWKAELRLKTRDGRTLSVLAETAVEQAESGELKGYVGSLTDISEIKRAGRLAVENAYLKEEVMEASAIGEIVGRSPPLKRLLRQIEMVASTQATVLIQGESGTGKELVAREIHERSHRNEHQMIRVNCASIPRELFESEFFGHVKGAFTGALKDRVGRFEAADGSTLFLDEVAEIPAEMQVKLLRVLQEGQYERLGEDRTRQVDVRLIAATNRDLKAEVEAGRFREDLYYRLNVYPVTVPPLRERKDDIPLLARHFLYTASRKIKSSITPELTPARLKQLQGYLWPGNIRELQNVIERAVITARENELSFDLSPPADWPPSEPPHPEKATQESPEVTTEAEMRRRERDNLIAALKKANGKIYGHDGAAALLGLKPTTLSSRMRKFGLEAPRRR